MITLKFGFSPCPNDTFILDALVNQKIRSSNINFEFHIADVEELNRLAFKGQLDITKLSFHAFGHITDQYQMFNSGAALGRNCGPLLISKTQLSPQELQECKVAIPGKYTTANLLLGLAYPEIDNKVEMLFSDIEEMLLNGEVDAGLIIHENRFTYQQKGLLKIRDLGEYWEESQQQPIPLGGMVIKRSLSESLKQEVNQLIHQSLRLAFDDPMATMPYVRHYAQEMDPKVIQQHIELYVNDFSLNLGAKGRKAVQTLFEKAVANAMIPSVKHPIFVTN